MLLSPPDSRQACISSDTKRSNHRNDDDDQIHRRLGINSNILSSDFPMRIVQAFFFLILFISTRPQQSTNFHRNSRNSRENVLQKFPKFRTVLQYPLSLILQQCGKIVNNSDFIKVSLTINNEMEVMSTKENCFLSSSNPINDFCNVFCSLFGTKQSGQELEVYHHLVQMIHNTRMEKEKLNLPYRRDKVALLYWNNPHDIESYPRNYVDAYELKTAGGKAGLAEVLKKVVSEYDVIIVEFGGEMICSRSIVELLFYSKCTVIIGMSHYKQFQIEIGRWFLTSPLENPVNTIYDSEMKVFSVALFDMPLEEVYPTVSQYLGRNQFILSNMSQFAYHFALDHLTIDKKCTNLLQSHSSSPNDIIRTPTQLSLVEQSFPIAKQTFNDSELSKFIVVVSRFHEPYDTMDYLVSIPHLINNRGEKSDVKSYLNIVHDEMNQGRESSVYLKYIIDHYEKLPEVMIFSQADPVHEFDKNYSSKDRSLDIQMIAHVAMIKDKEFSSIFTVENDGFAFLSRTTHYVSGAFRKIHLQILFSALVTILGTNAVFNR
jgi:hypothetical protein